MTPTERKAGKKERIKKLLSTIGEKPLEPMVREEPWFAHVLERERIASCCDSAMIPCREGESQ